MYFLSETVRARRFKVRGYVLSFILNLYHYINFQENGPFTPLWTILKFGNLKAVDVEDSNSQDMFFDSFQTFINAEVFKNTTTSLLFGGF